MRTVCIASEMTRLKKQRWTLRNLPGKPTWHLAYRIPSLTGEWGKLPSGRPRRVGDLKKAAGRLSRGQTPWPGLQLPGGVQGLGGNQADASWAGTAGPQDREDIDLGCWSHALCGVVLGRLGKRTRDENMHLSPLPCLFSFSLSLHCPFWAFLKIFF